MQPFRLNNGPLVRMINELRIGQGGFGNVYKGKWHKDKVAFKCVLVDLRQDAHKETEEFLSQNPELRSLSYPQVIRLQKEIEEFRKPFSLSGPGILQPIDFFRQQDQVDEGKKTLHGSIWWQARNYNVYVYPLYHCNLYELHNQYHNDFNDRILEHILTQCLQSLSTLDKNNTTHNDIKPQNFLVKFLSDKKKLLKTKIMLTDFGLTDTLGGTPIFASPEVGF